MRITFYLCGVVIIILGILALLPAFAHAYKPNNTIGFFIAAALLCTGIPLLIAGIKNYKGGLPYFFAVMLISLALLLLCFSVDVYLQENYTSFYVGLAFSSGFAVAGAFLAWWGHKRHRRIQAEWDAQHAAQAETPETTLYPPLKIWWLFGFLFSSFMLYAPFLTYRTIKNLDTLLGKKRDAAFYAIGTLLPVVYWFTYYEMAKETWGLSAQKKIPIKIPLTLAIGGLVLCSVIPFLIPHYLLPISVAVSTVPWLILQHQMNQLHCAEGVAQMPSAMRPPSAMQRVMLSLGIFVMISVTAGAIRQPPNTFKIAQSKGETLASGDTVLGKTRIYQLHVDGQNWKRVKPGTIYPDTELELLGKTDQDWVVARAFPNQNSTLNTIVDSRRNLVSSNFKNYQVNELRTLDSGGNLIPLSIAHYTGTEANSRIPQSLYVATIVTEKNIVEVVGHSLKEGENEMGSIVRSLHLVNQENGSW